MNAQVPYPTPPSSLASVASSPALSFLSTSSPNSPNLQSPPSFYTFPNALFYNLPDDAQISNLSIGASVSIHEDNASMTSPLLPNTLDANSAIGAADERNYDFKISKSTFLLVALIGGSIFSTTCLSSQFLPIPLPIPFASAILLAVFCIGRRVIREHVSLMRSEPNTGLIDALV